MTDDGVLLSARIDVPRFWLSEKPSTNQPTNQSLFDYKSETMLQLFKINNDGLQRLNSANKDS